ncbi:MAG: hypothetical protein F9K48_04880 [Candidatus Brocadia sp.]|nr:MAG: hypothetical protein F9K48_04880 [Candidatus Brocadia sp.]
MGGTDKPRLSVVDLHDIVYQSQISRPLSISMAIAKERNVAKRKREACRRSVIYYDTESRQFSDFAIPPVLEPFYSQASPVENLEKNSML